jgi:hypothetical protein
VSHIRRSTLVVAMVLIGAVAAACAPPVSPPAGAQRVSPVDGTGYIGSIISGDGDTVLYRREADTAVDPTPRDLVVTTVSTGATRVLPAVSQIQAVAEDGSTVVHGVDTIQVTDTTTGDSYTVRTGNPIGTGRVAVSADGRTVVFTEYHLTNGFCPCDLRLHVWRDGVEVLDRLLMDEDVPGPGTGFGSFVAVDAAGERAYLQQFYPHAIVELDLATDQITPLPVQFPAPDPDVLAGYDDVEDYHLGVTRVDFGASDGSAFRYWQTGTSYLVRPGQPPLELPRNQVSDPPASLSPNGRWIAWVAVQPTLPGQVRRSYRVRDLVSGQERVVVTSIAAEDPRFEPRSTFSGTGAVADSGRATFGQWAAPAVGPWPPSVIYVQG